MKTWTIHKNYTLDEIRSIQVGDKIEIKKPYKPIKNQNAIVTAVDFSNCINFRCCKVYLDRPIFQDIVTIYIDPLFEDNNTVYLSLL